MNFLFILFMYIIILLIFKFFVILFKKLFGIYFIKEGDFISFLFSFNILSKDLFIKVILLKVLKNIRLLFILLMVM